MGMALVCYVQAQRYVLCETLTDWVINVKDFVQIEYYVTILNEALECETLGMLTYSKQVVESSCSHACMQVSKVLLNQILMCQNYCLMGYLVKMIDEKVMVIIKITSDHCTCWAFIASHIDFWFGAPT